MIVLKRFSRVVGKQQTQKKDPDMCKKNKFVAVVLASVVGALSLASSQNLFAQCTDSCPPGATDTAVAVGLAAFLVNPDGTVQTTAIGSRTVGICRMIQLRMSVQYSTP